MTSLFMYAQGLLARVPVRSERGATAVEYGLLVALIAAVIIAVVTTLGTTLSSMFNNVVTGLLRGRRVSPAVRGAASAPRTVTGPPT